MRIVSERRRELRVRARPKGASLHPWSVGAKAAPGLYLAADVAEAAGARAKASLDSKREELGLLVGDFFEDRGGALFAVAGALVSSPQDATATHVRFTPSRFEELARDIDRVPFEHVLVGWFHTHLGIGATLSPTDLATQRRYFAAPHQITWVLDPVKRESRAFLPGARGPLPAGVSVLDAPASELRTHLNFPAPHSPRTRASNTSR